MELLVTFNGEVKSLEGALLLKKMWEIYRLMKWKFFSIQGLVNLMTLNLKKITLFTLVPQNLKKFKSFL